MATSGKQLAAVRETRKGATIHKTNERPGTRAQVRYVRVSAYKAREVLDLIRGKHVAEADEILDLVERDIADVIRKALASAVANAVNNDSQDPEALQVVACYADEGPTLKRWRPRARGRATRIRKRTCHITIIVSPMPAESIARRNASNSGRSVSSWLSKRPGNTCGVRIEVVIRPITEALARPSAAWRSCAPSSIQGRRWQWMSTRSGISDCCCIQPAYQCDSL